MNDAGEERVGAKMKNPKWYMAGRGGKRAMFQEFRGEHYHTLPRCESPKLQHTGTLVVFRIKRNRGSLSRNFKKKSLPLVVRMLHDRKSIIGLSMNIFRENLFRFDFGIKYSNILAAVDSLRFLRRFFFQNNHSSNLKISWCLMLRLKVY